MGSTRLLRADSLIARSPDQLAGEIDDQCVLLDIASGHYVHFNVVGSRIWSLLETPTTAGSLVDRLVDEFDVDRAACERQVMEFLRDLLEHGLIRADERAPQPGPA